jgi:hypothetical protein
VFQDYIDDVVLLMLLMIKASLSSDVVVEYQCNYKVYSYYYLIYYLLDQSPLWIDHVGYCKRTKSPFADCHNVIVIGRKRIRPQNISKRPQNIIKVVITTQKKNSALPVKGQSHTWQSCINKEASASLRCTLTCSFERQVSELQLKKRERERHIFRRGLFVLV